MRKRKLSVLGKRAGDRGAVLVIVAAFTVVAVVMLAAVVDLGHQREQRKEVTLSTDAAALAAASMANTEGDAFKMPSGAFKPSGAAAECEDVGFHDAAVNGEGFSDVQEVVENYLGRNGGTGFVDCKVVRMSYRRGYVLVSGSEIVDYSVGPAFGQESGSVNGVSVAAIVDVYGGGLRPIGICAVMETMSGVDGYPVLSLDQLYKHGTATYGLTGDGYVYSKADPAMTPTTFTARFPIDKVKGGSCVDPADPPASGSGNFGRMDFGGDPNESCTDSGHFCKDYADGFYDELSNPSKGNTGNWAGAATESSSTQLEQYVGQFWAPVFTKVSDNGGNALFEMEYFVQMEMVNHCFNAAGCKFDGAQWFDFRVSRMLPFVEAGPGLTDNAQGNSTRLCAVTNDGAAISSGCPAAAVVTVTAPPASSTTTTLPDCEILTQPESKVGALKSGGDIGPPGVTFVVEVNNMDACLGMSWTLVRQSDGALHTFSSFGTNKGQSEYSAIASAGPFVAGEVWDVVITQGVATLSDVAALTITD